MVKLTPPFRIAVEADAMNLAELVNFAGEGLPFHIWSGLARNGENPWTIGRDRQAEKVRDGQVIVMDVGEGVIAALTGYVIGPDPEPIGSDFPALFRPLQELENEALQSWYINVLACYPDHRGKGYGTRLMQVAEDICRSIGLLRLCLIVASNNTDAWRLYERLGYVRASSRRCVRNGWETDTECWDLMIKTLQ